MPFRPFTKRPGGGGRGGSRGKPGGGGRGGFRGKPGGGSRGPGRYGSESGSRFFRKKTNRLYTVFPGQIKVDYKDTDRLGKFLTEKGKILPRRITALTAKQQRMLARAIKRARQTGLLPYSVE